MGNTAENHTFGFVGLSGVLHAALVILVTLFAGELIQKPILPPVTEIEIISASAPAPSSVSSSPAAVLPTPQAVATALPAAPATNDDSVVVQAPSTHKKKPVATKHAPMKPLRTANAPKALMAHTPRLGKPVAAPNFETVDLDEAPAIVTPQFDDGMIADDLAAAERDDRKQTQSHLAALEAAADQDADAAENEAEQSLAALEKQRQEDVKKMAAISAQHRASDQAALDKALADANARAQAEKAAREASAAAAAAASQLAARNAANQKQGAHGKGGSNLAATAEGTGEGSGIRGIQDLRQKPGNKRPQYDSEDRFQGRQGQVVFKAYVTKDGNLTQFEILQSSGHRSLDYKTLKALKEWKFYPGQEGLVEIPFQWDLKGGPQEMATGLRTKVSQSNRPADLRSTSN
jgi:TonB family protein